MVAGADSEEAIEQLVIATHQEAASDALRLSTRQQKMRLGAVEDRNSDTLGGEHCNMHGKLDVALNDERIEAGLAHDFPYLRGGHCRESGADLAGFIAIDEDRVSAFEQIDVPNDFDPELLVDCPAQAEISQVYRHRLDVGRAIN